MRTRFVLAIFALIVAFVAPARAQEILVTALPVYSPGESYVGKAYIPDLKIATDFRQTVISGKNEETYLQTDIVLADGSTVERSTTNLVTGLGTDTTRTRTLTAISTTCTRAVFFPVYIGKQGDCSSVDEVNGQKVTSSTHWEFTNAAWTPTGSVISICVTLTGEKVVSYVCSTSDMKWVRFMTITYR